MRRIDRLNAGCAPCWTHETPVNVLFLCSRNQWRSPTAERVFRDTAGWLVRSRGLAASARRQLTERDVAWADVIVVMERRHAQTLRERFRGSLADRPVHVLSIPDRYPFMDPDLVALLRERVPAALGLDAE